MSTISLCMIVKNEENNIDRCLSSVYDIVDEIIIVDTGSTDNTISICKKFTNKIYSIEWEYNFAKARNFSIQNATSDYLFFLDADDIIDEYSREEFKKLKKSMNNNIDLYYFTYQYRTDFSFDSERLFKNFKGVKWEGVIHEKLINIEKLKNTEKTNIIITHTSNHDNTKRYIDFFRKNIELGHKFNNREKYYFADELFKNKLYDEAYPYLIELNNSINISNYEKHYVNELLGLICKNRNDFLQAIRFFTEAIFYYQPVPLINYNMAECYRNIGNFNMAIYYYKTIINDLMFEEKFINNVVMGDFNNEIREYKIQSLLSLVMIYFYDLNDKKMAAFYNSLLLSIDSDNEAGLINKIFFDNLKGDLQ